MYVTAQVFMTLNVLFFIFACFAKNKTILFLLQAISSLFFTLQYLCLGAWAGFFCALAEFVRVTLFYFYEKHNAKRTYQILTCVVAYIITVALSIIMWQAWYSILPLVGTFLLFLTLFSKKLTIVKLGLLATVSCSLAYLILIGSYYGAVLEAINLLLGIVGTINDLKKAKQKLA